MDLLPWEIEEQDLTIEDVEEMVSDEGTFTSNGWIENGYEIIDILPNKLFDKGKASFIMLKCAGYFLTNVVIPYISKRPNSKIKLININYLEYCFLYYLKLNQFVDKTKLNLNSPSIILNSLEFNKVEQMLDYSVKNNSLRILIESLISCSSQLVNSLWMLDNKGKTPNWDLKEDEIILSNINSYSRPDLLELDNKIYNEFTPENKKVVILPCSSSRPYHKRKFKIGSNTNTSGKNKFIIQDYIDNKSDYDKLVLTSAGIVPQEYWKHPIIMTYNTGTRDLWKLLILCKNFFTKNKYDKYEIVVGLKPYRDIIRLLICMNVIDEDKVEFIGEDCGPNKVGMQFYPKFYKDLFENNLIKNNKTSKFLNPENKPKITTKSNKNPTKFKEKIENNIIIPKEEIPKNLNISVDLF